MSRDPSGNDVFARLWIYLGRHKLTLGAGLACLAATTAFALANPFVIRYGVNSLNESVTEERLLFYAGVIVGLTVLQGIFRFLMRWLMIGVSRQIEYQLRADVFHHLQRLPLSFYQRNFTGDLMSRATNDLSNVRMLLGPGLMYPASTILTTVFAVALMLTIDWRLTLIALFPLPLISFAVYHFGERIHVLSEATQRRLADLSARVQENLAGVRVVRVFLQEKHEEIVFKELNQSLKEKNMDLVKVTSLFYPTMQFTIGFAAVVVLWFGGRQVANGSILLGDFVAFTFYLAMLAFPMIAVGWVVNLWQRGKASMARLNFILDTTPAIADAPDAVDPEIRGDLEIRDLTFAYDGAPVLEHVSLHVPAGSSLAIVGPTGAGKSTLAQLIPRLHDPPPGTIFLDGIPLERIRLERLRRAIGFVPQDTFLFGETVFENIAFGVESASKAEVEEAARISDVYKDIADFPQGFDTMVGERGITLSGGQKQRAAISRAVIRDPKILILDDALSSVDTHTEDRILGALRRVLRGRTSILISHRVSTVKEADTIVVLEDGRIVERGTHEELLRGSGRYAEMHRRQQLEAELAVTD